MFTLDQVRILVTTVHPALLCFKTYIPPYPSFLSFISLVASFIYLPNIEREHFLRSSRMTVKYRALLSSLRDKRELFFTKGKQYRKLWFPMLPASSLTDSLSLSEGKKQSREYTNQVESFPIRVHGIVIEIRLSGILNITGDTPIVTAEIGSIHLTMKVCICKK